MAKWGIVFGSESTFALTSSEGKHRVKYEKFDFLSTPLQVFSKIQESHENAYLLESIEGPKKLARYSFIGFDPALTLETKNGETRIRNQVTGEKQREKTDNPLFAVRKIIKSRTIKNREFRFTGGAVGFLSYDAVRYWEKLPKKTHDDLNFPDAQFGFFDDGIIFEHGQKRAVYYYLTHNRLSEIAKLMKKPDNINTLSYSQPKANVSKNHFLETVTRAKRYVATGDIFQVVLSKRYDFNMQGSLEFYRSLRDINPSPYMYFLKAGDRQIIGASPEMLVRVDNQLVETFPIAGTRPTTINSIENRRLARELLADPKERAEHVMLVDLARNDLGKISKYGSVRVTEFMKVHKYSHVQHIVSRVEGQLREEQDCFDALSAVFPAGTVSGAPKVSAMEIIEELEQTRRGPYAGAVGYFGYNGNADFAITIRTLFADKNKAHIQAGAGIVADSIPEKEWLETEQKAAALMKALKSSGE
jgi:anthranilate synthase component 1